MKRKILTVIFIIIFALSLPGVCLAEKLGAEDIHLLLNGNYLESTDEPCIIEGRVMVPFAEICKALDISVSRENKAIILQTQDKKIALTLASKTAEINGDTVNLDVPAQIVNGRVMVPLRFVGESLGYQVWWQNEERTAYMQEVYQAAKGKNTVILMPIKPDMTSAAMIFNGMQVVINGETHTYDWQWNASIWEHIVYAEPEISWKDINDDGKEEIIITLTDGINRGTGVLKQDRHVLTLNGAEIKATEEMKD